MQELYSTVGNCRPKEPGFIQIYNNSQLMGKIPIKDNHLKAFAILDGIQRLVGYVKGQGSTLDRKRMHFLDTEESVELWNLPEGYSVQCVSEAEHDYRTGKLFIDHAKDIKLH